jgi:leucyl aminopeptidase
MEVTFKDLSPEKINADLLAFPVREKRLEEPALRRLDRLLGGKLSQQIRKSKFTGAEGSILLHSTGGKLGAPHLLLVGMGKEQETEIDLWRRAGARAHKEAASLAGESLAFFFSAPSEAAKALQAVVEGVVLNSYRFDRYRSEKNSRPSLKSLTLAGVKKTAAAEAAVRLGLDLTPAVFLARDLVNEPPSVTTARYLGEQALRHCRGRGVNVEVWGKKKIQAMNMAGLLAVNRGSVEEPRFIVIRYRPPRAKKKVALIGKGITFDSGGLSLKPSKSMETMKLDMSGAAALIGIMSVIDKLKPLAEVAAFIPCTDNLPSGSAQKPGDVIRYMNGKTAEVVNTDAEGRLILADALALAAREKPDCMITVATLTGACMVALGQLVGGIFGNRESLVEQLIACGAEAGEKLWHLPLVKEYRDDIKSSVADIKNVGGAYGGAIAAALFLQEFVGDVPWAHLDIAGPAFTEKEALLCPRGGTGFSVRTLARFLSNI